MHAVLHTLTPSTRDTSQPRVVPREQRVHAAGCRPQPTFPLTPACTSEDSARNRGSKDSRRAVGDPLDAAKPATCQLHRWKKQKPQLWLISPRESSQRLLLRDPNLTNP